MIANKKRIAVGAVAVAAFTIALMAHFIGAPRIAYFSSAAGAIDNQRSATAPSRVAAADRLAAQNIELPASEMAKFKVEPAQEHEFKIQREAVGDIEFNQDMSVQVFPPFAGRIISLFAKAGDDVQKGATLFTIDSPDVIEAETKLISAAGTLNVTGRALERAKQLYEVQGFSQKDLDQAIADQQAAEGALKAARDALRIFGKTDAEMDRIVAERRVDSVLAVHSPIAGRITARNAAPGLYVQPASAPAPYTVSDISTMWMVANVAETDFPFVRLGEEVSVTVQAYPDRVFRGKIVNIGAAVDSNTRRVLMRSEIRDPKHELRPGMFATFEIQTGKAMRSVAVPVNGVVREGDGTMSIWVTSDRKHLVRRTVKTGLQQDGLTQIVEGLRSGELVATDGALFLDNALTEASR